MSKSAWIVLGLVLILIGLALAISPGEAGGPIPPGVSVFEIPSGQVCVVFPDGSGECYCPCEGGQCEESFVVPRPTATPPDNQPTVAPSVSPSPVPTATAEIPTATVEPTATPKVRCNKGGGNGSEGCDPGNNPDNGNDDE